MIVKGSLPVTRAAVPRARLFRRLERARTQAPVVWIQGGAGSGKTTLLASFLRHAKIARLWYSMDASDADLATFFHQVAQVTPNAARAKLPNPTREHILALDVFMRTFFERLGAHLPRGAVVAFDNFQEARLTPPAVDALLRGLRSLREGQTVFVLSREPPPESLASLEVAGHVVRVGDAELALTEGEARALIRKRTQGATHVWSDAACHALWRRTKGWSAGIVLMLDQPASGAPSADVPELLSAYLVREYIARLPAETQHVLGKTAFVPTLSQRGLRTLGLAESAETILRRLADRGTFVTRHADHHFEVHPLLREVLQQRQRDTLAPGKLRRMLLTAAQTCELEGRHETAMSLFAEARSHDDVLRLIEARAQTLIDRGQHETLRRWLLLLPDELTRTDARAAYWQGAYLSGREPSAAATAFARAFELEETSRDPSKSRLLLAWAGATYNIIANFDQMTSLDRWIEAFARHVPAGKVAIVRSHFVMANLLNAINYRGFDHPRGREWRDHGLALLQQGSPSPSDQLLLAYSLARCFRFTGDLSKMRLVAKITQRTRETAGDDPLGVIYGAATEAFIALQCGEHERCEALVAHGLTAAFTLGIPIWNHLLSSLGALAALLTNHLSAARDHLATMERSKTHAENRLARAHHAYLSAFALLLEGDAALALEVAQAAAQTISTLGAVVPEALARLLLAEIHAVLADRAAADEALADLFKIRGAQQSEFVNAQADLIRAQLAHARGDANEARAWLASSLSKCRRFGATLLLPLPMPSRVFSDLCALALREGIETEAVHELLRRRPTLGFVPPQDLVTWPWQVTLRLFGRLSICAGGVPVQVKGKLQARVLELLTLVVLRGGSASETWLVDALWPDAEGDAAERALAVTVFRLRKLLGDATLVERRSGVLSLDRRRVWTDVWAAEALMDRARRSLDTGEWREELQQAQDWVESTIAYPGKQRPAWLSFAHDQLRSKLQRLLERAETAG